MRENTFMSRRAFLKDAVSSAALGATVLFLSGKSEGATAPVKSIIYPTKGKPIFLIVPWPPGGAGDTAIRIQSPFWEKELGSNIEILNKAGAGSQIGTNELARSKPDGHTIVMVSLPTLTSIYLQQDRKAVFTRKSFEPLAQYIFEPGVIAVRANSPYKDLQSLLDAAKANPGKISMSATGILAMNHLALLLLEKAAGVKFACVQFDGGAPARTAVLGGHVDSMSATLADVSAMVSGGQMRMLTTMGQERSSFFPDVKTCKELGLNFYFGSSRGLAMPGGTPKEIVETFAGAVKRVCENDEAKKKVGRIGLEMHYLPPEEYAKYWGNMEDITKELLEQEGVKVIKG